ncbi:MAG TPA: NAD(P)/FAD-dependent oxidoreductase [Thermodesulfobacteriota bacterium]|nr:NAD(P)/FAD-dependent oxidoreductase [Thermodesulfobacteriota bacterium]
MIGAGMGGLTAAAHLVKAGLRVLVLERNPHIGGTAYVYHRKGFTFPMGPLGFSHLALVQNILKNLGVGEGLKFARVHYRIRAFGLDLPLSLPFSELVEVLAKHFPTDAEAVQQFFKDMNGLIPKQEADPNRSRLHQKHSISASEYLHHLIKDGRLRRVLGSIGTREPYSGLPLLAAMWNLMSDKGIWYPEEGMQPFCERFVKALVRGNENRGEIRLNTDVAKIRVDHGKVWGVILKDGTQIDSSSIISNADYKTAFLKLMDPKMIPDEWYDAISSARQTGSVFQVCLGVDAGKADLSTFKKASRLIYRRDGANVQEGKNLDWNAHEIDPEALAGQELEVSLWGKDWATVSSVGRASVVIRAEAEYHHFAKYRLGWRRRSPNYQAYKTRLAQALIREIEDLIPGLEKSILVMDVATPLTFEDQGGRSGGAVAGWSWDYKDFRGDRPEELIGTPIKGLYMAGYQAFSALFMGGIPTAMESGKRAAKAVFEGVPPLDEISIPGKK